MLSKLNLNPLGERYVILFAVGFVLIGLLAWYAFDSLREDQSRTHPNPDLSLNPTSDRKIVPTANTQADSQSDRPLELNLPAIGMAKGAKWIRNVAIPQQDGTKFPLLDILVDDEGRFLTARRGDEAFSSFPNLDVYWKVLKQQTSDRNGLKKQIKSVQHLPLPWPSREAEAGIVSAGGRGELTDRIKIHTWVPVVVEFQDDPALYATMISIRTEGAIVEGWLYRGAGELMLNPNKHLYQPPVVAGANRFATLVKITTGSISGLPSSYVEYNPVGLGGVFLTEAWAGMSPWSDNQIDPIYGDRRPDESYIPDDMAVSYENIIGGKHWSYTYALRKDGTVRAPLREEAEARYQARLAREAAEKEK